MDPAGFSVTPLARQTCLAARRRFLPAMVVLLGFIHVLGSQDVRIGPSPVPAFPTWWLFVAGGVVFLVVPRATAARTPRLAAWVLVTVGSAFVLAHWQAELSKGPAPLIALVHREQGSGPRPDRRILVDEIRVSSRRALRRLAGVGQHVNLTAEGFIHLPSTGIYRIDIRCDDRCALTIGTKLIGAGSDASFDVPLEAGTYPLQIDYRQGTGAALLSLGWDRPRWVELLPMRKLISGRREVLTAGRIRGTTWQIASFILLSTGWWISFVGCIVRVSESRQALYDRLVLGWSRLDESVSPEGSSAGAVSMVDWGIVAGFLLLSVLFQLAHVSDRPPHVILYSDAANIATFAAARDHPELFRGDGLLGDRDRSRWYPTIHVPLIRAIARLTGDYGSAFMSMLGLHAFMLGMGFYILGRVVFASRYWAFLLAVAAVMRVGLNLGEFWGLYRYPIPRMTFQALLPFVAAGAYHWRARPKRWPYVMVGAGLLIYVHPVSAPAWGLAFWLGFCAFLPLRSRWMLSVAAMIGLGALFLAVTGPFLWHYLTFQQIGSADTTGSYEEIHRIIEARFVTGYLDLPQAFRDFVREWGSVPGRWLLWLFASLGAVSLVVLRRRDKRSVLLVLFWLLGLLLTSVALPVVDHAVARAHQSFPVQYDLIRGVRYLVPMLLLFSLWPLAEIGGRFRGIENRLGARTTMILGSLLVGIWAYWHPPVSTGRLLSCWSDGRLACGSLSVSAAEALEAVHELVPPGAPILATDLTLPIRYFSLRPVVWSYKDGGLLAYVDHGELIEWNARKRELTRALLTEDPGRRFERLAVLGEGLGARFLFLRSKEIEGLPTGAHDIVWRNRDYALVSIHRPRDGF